MPAQAASFAVNMYYHYKEKKMDIYTYLQKDHRKVSRLFKKLITSKSAPQRKSFFQQIEEELLLHATTENETFYNMLRQHPESEPVIDHAKEEHDDIKKLLKKLNKIRSNSIEWLVMLGELKSVVEHHVHEEETKIFNIAKDILTDEEANSLAQQMDALKKSE